MNYSRCKTSFTKVLISLFLTMLVKSFKTLLTFDLSSLKILDIFVTDTVFYKIISYFIKLLTHMSTVIEYRFVEDDKSVLIIILIESV